MAANIRAASPPPSSRSPDNDEKMLKLFTVCYDTLDKIKFLDELQQAKKFIKPSSSRGNTNWSSNDDNWEEDPTILELRDLLLKKLDLSFEGAIKEIVKTGYTEAQARWAVSNIKNYRSSVLVDVGTNIVVSAKENLESESILQTPSGEFNSKFLMKLLVNAARRMVPLMSIAEVILYMMSFDCGLGILKMADYFLKKDIESGYEILDPDDKGEVEDFEYLAKYVTEFATDDTKQYWAEWAIEQVKKELKRVQEDSEKLSDGTLKAEQEEIAKKMAEKEKPMSLATGMAIGRLVTKEWEPVLSVEDMKKGFDYKKELIKQYWMKDESEKDKIEKSFAEVQKQMSQILKLTAPIEAAGVADSKASSSTMLPEVKQRLFRLKPCGHLAVCASCSDDLNLTKCPRCQATITGHSRHRH